MKKKPVKVKIKQYADIKMLSIDMNKLARKYNVNILYGCLQNEILYGSIGSKNGDNNIRKREILDLYEVGARMFQFIREHIKIILKIN